MDLETYDEEMDGIDDVLLDERLKKISPEWWCRIESYQLADLLRTARSPSPGDRHGPGSRQAAP